VTANERDHPAGLSTRDEAGVDGSVAAMVGQEGRRQQEQVENRKHQQVGSIVAIGIAASVQPECEPNEDRPGNNGDRHVDCTDKAECPRGQRNRNQAHAE
jgi:hypothetical protein